MWKEFEDSLFDTGLNTRTVSSGITPDVGDIVDIVIESKVPGRLYEYRARIVSEGMTGEGIITPHDIVAYPINPGIEAFQQTRAQAIPASTAPVSRPATTPPASSSSRCAR